MTWLLWIHVDQHSKKTPADSVQTVDMEQLSICVLCSDLLAGHSNLSKVCPTSTLANFVGGVLGGDILHEAELWGLGVAWGDVNSTGSSHRQLHTCM